MRADDIAHSVDNLRSDNQWPANRSHLMPLPPPPPRYAVHPRAAHRAVGGEVFIVTGDRAFHRLSVPSAVDLFAAVVAGQGDRAQLLALLVARYAVNADVAARDLDAFLDALLSRGVLVADEPVPVQDGRDSWRADDHP
jgi:hypothetical protein